jgi:hypothetical protein
MGKLIQVTIERAHTRTFEVAVVDGPTSTQVRDFIRRSPHGLARWVLARDRIFLAAADILHVELVGVPKSLGLVYSTDGGLWWDEARNGFRIYVNDPLRESLISTEPAFWRMVRPHPVYVIQAQYRHHLDAPLDAWVELRPGTEPERSGRRDRRRDEAAVQAWEQHGAVRLKALAEALGDRPDGNYTVHLRAKAAEALASGPPTIWQDGDRMRSERIDWRCDEAGSFVHMEGRRVAVRWSDTSTRHPVYSEAICDHFRVVKVARAWDDGEELDPVDRIIVEAEICGMMATDGIDTVPPEALADRRRLAEARADGYGKAGWDEPAPGSLAP